ncbi:MAG TPA: 2-amino-4-hydroxy-6-hydroxymethyldihydropteridine diphosphokinase, partial [Solirubrobacteraceae bacterium]|nr:2-amino-4-hydroxy-6-hydroxymethyldihydropteridine diphosphokinase [Solirubrobacteraceae bacterium]
GGVRHGPRPIDVDVLLLGDLELESERLRLPHREVGTRRFVLAPLLELDPGLVVPGAGRAADALAALGTGQEVRVVGPPLDIRG